MVADHATAELVLAADQFVITPAGRVEDAARAHAAGDEVRTVIAGYHWFTDWGRDTMISLEGLTLTTGRISEARRHPAHLRALRPRRPDPQPVSRGQQGGPLSHRRRDAVVLPRPRSLSRRHAAIGRPLQLLLPKLHDIVEHHLRGTRFGIGVDPADGLLRQGAEGYQLTWMDAKVGDWVVTPRRGKAVEINALWYNALRLLDGLAASDDGDATPRADARAHAERARESFNRRFWYEDGGYLYDVVDGEQRRRSGLPAQSGLRDLAALSRCSTQSRWRAVLDVVAASAAHAGRAALARARRIPTTRPRTTAICARAMPPITKAPSGRWLIGPFIDAWLKVHPDDAPTARALPRRLRRRISTKPASARSARSSTPRRRTPRAAASRRPGASPRSCAAGSRPPARGDAARGQSQLAAQGLRMPGLPGRQ